MAEEREEETEEQKQEETPAKNSKKIMLIGGLVGGLLLFIGAPVLYLMLSGSPEPEEEHHDQIDHSAASAEHYQEVQVEGYLAEDELLEGEEPLGAMYPFETFVVNLQGGGFLRTQIQVEFVSRDIPRRFMNRLVKIRDGLIILLSAQNKEQLLDTEGKERLKQDIQDTLNQILRKEEVQQVYFSQFVVQ